MNRAVEQLQAGDLAHVEPLRQWVLGFLARHPDALLRSCEDGHLTASALVVDPTDGRFVVLHHRKTGLWLQPGGHADGDDDLAAVALKEATEETGLDGLAVRRPAVDLDIHLVPFLDGPLHIHLDLRFVVLARPGAADAGPPPGNDESHALRWVTLADLDAGGDAAGLHADASLRRLAERGLASLGLDVTR